MLLDEILVDRNSTVEPVVRDTFTAVRTNMSHTGDLMLTYLHGSFPNSTGRPSVGPQFIGLAYNEQQSFIKWYRDRFHFNYREEEYDNQIRANTELLKLDHISTQLEMQLYIGLWESDYYQKQLYQLSRLINGLPYDWYRQTPTDTSNSVDESIASFRRVCPRLYGMLRNCYSSHIRNRIAHSLYFLSEEGITFIEENNEINTEFESINDWRRRIATTLLVYNAIQKEFIEYADSIVESLQGNQGFEVCITNIDGTEHRHFITPRIIANSAQWVWL